MAIRHPGGSPCGWVTLIQEILTRHGFDFGLENRVENGETTGVEVWVGF